MRSEWRTRILYDLAGWRNGLAFRNISFSETGKPIIKIAELKNGITGQTRFTSDEFDSSVALTRGDILFSWSGNPETSIDVFIYDLPDGWLNQHIFKVTPREVDKSYLFYLLKYLKPTFAAIASNKQTTGLGHVTIRDMKELSVLVPPRDEQISIAKVLSSIDERINLNLRINNHLEQIAHTIFREYCSDGDTALLSDILTVCYGKDHKHLKDGDIPCYGSGGIMRYVNEALYSSESVLIPRKGSLNNVLYINRPFWTVDTMFFTHMTRPNVAKFVYFTVRRLDLAGMNVGSAVPSMTTAVLNALEIVLPSEASLASFEETVRPIFLQMQANNDESAHLAAVRDNLLPRLMSGEITVINTCVK